jgi:hypothetical protein
MSEQDKAAIEIVKNLSSNIRTWAITLVSVFTIGVIGFIFWSGVTKNKVENNSVQISENAIAIKDLTKVVNDYIKEQQTINASHVTENDFEDEQDYWQEAALNWAHLAWWAETKGYVPLARSTKKKKEKKED